MTNEQLPPISLGIKYDPVRMDWVKIDARKYDPETHTPMSWAVCKGSMSMSKEDGFFYCEPQPSSRTEDFLNEFRFNSVDEALETYLKFHSR